MRVDRLRTQRLKRAPAAVDQRFTNRKGGLDPAVLGELAIQVGLDVAARQFAHGDGPEVRQQVDLKLAPHVSQAVRAQPLSDFALIVLVSERRDGRHFALDVVSLQRWAPGSGEDLAGDQPCLMFSACTIHALVAAPEVDHLGGVTAGAEPHSVAHDSVASGVLEDLAGGLARHALRLLHARTSAQVAIRRLGLPGSPRGDRPPVSPRWRRTHDSPYPFARDAQRCRLPRSELDRADLGGVLVDPTASHTEDLGRLGDGQQRRQGIQPSHHPDCSIRARRPRGLSSRCVRRIGDGIAIGPQA